MCVCLCLSVNLDLDSLPSTPSQTLTQHVLSPPPLNSPPCICCFTGRMQRCSARCSLRRPLRHGPLKPRKRPPLPPTSSIQHPACKRANVQTCKRALAPSLPPSPTPHLHFTRVSLCTLQRDSLSVHKRKHPLDHRREGRKNSSLQLQLQHTATHSHTQPHTDTDTHRQRQTDRHTHTHTHTHTHKHTHGKVTVSSPFW